MANRPAFGTMKYLAACVAKAIAKPRRLLVDHGSSFPTGLVPAQIRDDPVEIGLKGPAVRGGKTCVYSPSSSELTEANRARAFFTEGPEGARTFRASAGSGRLVA